MTPSLISHTQAGGGDVDAVFDVLHGHIDLTDLDPNTEAPIQNIITSPFIQRLRRIKQLGFVSQNFLSAQHNRYAHALGTMHIARKLIARVEVRGGVLNNALSHVNELAGDDSFNTKDPSLRARALARLKQHLLVAALIQDVGELPYERATAKIFVPGQEIRETVRNSQVDTSQLASKHLFTLYYVWDRRPHESYFRGLNSQILTFLITGIVPSGRRSPELQALRQIVDGAIDADRLDYVYRDALHTIGVHHSSEGLINSIIDYDEFGPTLTHSRPAADFMITRAALWSNVYLSPENRFRLILLRKILGALNKQPSIAKNALGWQLGEITHDQFEELHDPQIDDLIRKLHKGKPDLGKDAREALELLEEGAGAYEHRWVPVGEKSRSDWAGPIQLPSGFFFDTYADYGDHSLYRARSVKVIGDRFEYARSPLYLENCIGPFCRLLADGEWPALPMPGHMAWFLPRGARKEGLWASLFKFIDARQLTDQLEMRDQMQGVDFLFDTRLESGFTPPRIFISFATEDGEFADRVAGILYQHKRQYNILRGPTQGIGQSPARNSELAVEDAEAAIIVCSRDYVRIYRDETDGALATEVRRMTQRRTEIPIAIITLDKFEAVKDGLPYSSLNAENRRPFIGGALRTASSAVFRETILAALAHIDEHRKGEVAP